VGEGSERKERRKIERGERGRGVREKRVSGREREREREEKAAAATSLLSECIS
jgi:hypothetical protein